MTSDIEFKYSYRSFVSLTYAHYEGYCKQVIAQALDDISKSLSVELSCRTIKDVLFAAIIRKKLVNSSNSELISHLGSIPDLYNGLSFPKVDIILECGNLNVSNFFWSISSIGMSPKPFNSYRSAIGRITTLRHECAHGEEISFDPLKRKSEIASDMYLLQRDMIELMHLLAVNLIDHMETDKFAA